MINIRRILVPTDFSETSDSAMRYAIALARRFAARVHLLNVPDYPGILAEADYPIGIFETMQNAAHGRLRRLLTEQDVKELQPDYAVRIGQPAEEIVRYAHEHAVDLIVMGTHGREGVMRAVLGSVAETVVRRAPCPVLTVHHPEREFVAAYEPVRVRRFATA
jgi:nucleotide-binding universal stress UspA family protein